MRSMVAIAVLTFLVVSADSQSPPATTPPEGVLPRNAQGRPLNLDFETGTLQDWTTEGDAFVGQPVKGDTVYPRRGDMRSQHQGNYWIGGYEKLGDRPRGKLVSIPFKVTYPWASFLVGGGAHPDTCVELVDTQRNEVFFRTSGVEEENLRRVVVDLQRHQGKEISIRIVDNQTGHWGHVNFDDFRFHSTKPNFPTRTAVVLHDDSYKYAGLKPEEAASVMTVPEGFEVKLFAGEPDVRQPIAMCQDDRGRLWVAEAFCYPIRRKDSEASDRILIFEDTDGDGKFDKRTVFMEHLNLISGLELGFGGVWVGAAPYLMYIPIDASGDKPAGPPKILLDGWAYQDTHETLNTLTWGPDGWLYGCHGVFTHSKVGKPGTPDNERTRINAGIWRYHPTRHVFEVFAHGTSNPWGLDYNEYGQFFIEACVIPHCFHIIQGGRYLRQAGSHFNPYTYSDIDTIADHRHYLGATPHSGNNKSDAAGGGHAHCGLMCYLGGSWPVDYRGQLFMGNIHGRRLNVDRLKRKGSGYVASHSPDFLLANDSWARFINMQYGPDGNVFVFDWYDQQACHRTEPQIWDRSNGRIYKICYRGTNSKETDLKKLGGDLRKLTNDQLVDLQDHENEWYSRHARRILQERAVSKQAMAGPRGEVKLASADDAQGVKSTRLMLNQKDPVKRLRALWTAHAMGTLAEQDFLAALQDDSEYVRGWAVQLSLEDHKITPGLLHRFGELARNDASPVVRMYLASGLQRLPLDQRWVILEGLTSHVEDKEDQNLPHLYWYSAEPLAEIDTARALKLALHAKVPMLEYMVRRISSIDRPEVVQQLVVAITETTEPRVQMTILQGITAALKGRREYPQPAAWRSAYAALNQNTDPALRHQARLLGVVFGDQSAIEALLSELRDNRQSVGQRISAVTALTATRKPAVGQELLRLIGEPAMRSAALKALAAFDLPDTPGAIMGIYTHCSAGEKRDAVNTLASRPGYAAELLKAVANKAIPAADVPADVVRQLRALNNQTLNKQIAEVWGVVRNSPAERLRQIADAKKMLTTRPKLPADPALGRALYQKTCAQCHVLFGVGGKVGPDITGSNRADLNYLLENIFDPSAVIPKEYAATFLVLADGRSLTGIVKEQTEKTLTIVTATETLTLQKSDIETLKPSDVSMMPEDQLKPFSEQEVRSLIAYLQSPTQVPMLATADNAKDFFNGKDLTGWDGDPKLWSVENGEIVGKSPGIKRNEFLKSHMSLGNFRLKLKVKLTPDSGNSGVQFRSEPLPDGEMKGYQADIGQGWWGKLYEESGRQLLAKKDQGRLVRVGDWNDYEIVAQGNHIQTYLNGQPCVDLEDPPGAKSGIVGLQIHSGGAMEVRFKEIRLEILPR